MKKIIIMILAAVLLLTALSACGDTNAPASSNASLTESGAREILQTWLDNNPFHFYTYIDDFVSETESSFIFTLYQTREFAFVRIDKLTSGLFHSTPDGEQPLDDWYSTYMSAFNEAWNENNSASWSGWLGIYTNADNAVAIEISQYNGTEFWFDILQFSSASCLIRLQGLTSLSEIGDTITYDIFGYGWAQIDADAHDANVAMFPYDTAVFLSDDYSAIDWYLHEDVPAEWWFLHGTYEKLR